MKRIGPAIAITIIVALVLYTLYMFWLSEQMYQDLT